MTSFSALEWEAEQLGLLLGITGQDVTVPGLERSSTNTDLNMNTKSQHQRGDNANLNSREHSLPPFSVAEIKQPDVKEDFVHPGFYSLSSQSQSNSSIPSLVPLRMARKRSLQEEGSPILSCDVPGATNSVKRAGNRQSPQPYAAELRRYSLDGHLSTMAPVTTPPHSWAYSTPPKSPSTPSSLQGQINSTIESQQHSDAPPGQPYMTAFSSLGWTFGQKGLSPSLRHAHFTGFQRSSVAKPGSSSIPQSRKKRASKFKTDLLFPSVLGELQYPLNAVPPPLQQQHHQPYLLPQYAISTQQSLLQKQHSLLQRYRPTLLSQKGQRAHSRTSSYRRNPGEVPASTLPPDHFVFQEALLGIGCSGQASGVRSQSIPQTDTNPNVRESTRNEMQTLARSLSEPDDQLRLQEYLRSVEPTSTPSPPTTLATSIIACNSAIDCSSPSSSPVIHSL
ncbi:hypothetical protein BGX27_003585 [Mortierella sp. AM989]|nr:hypothetical protein BGX27_003585 [Mortierella sp. AM989]